MRFSYVNLDSLLDSNPAANTPANSTSKRPPDNINKLTKTESFFPEAIPGVTPLMHPKSDFAFSVEHIKKPSNRPSRRDAGKFLLIYIYNFHVLSDLLLIYICKLHWIRDTNRSAHSSRVAVKH